MPLTVNVANLVPSGAVPVVFVPGATVKVDQLGALKITIPVQPVPPV